MSFPDEDSEAPAGLGDFKFPDRTVLLYCWLAEARPALVNQPSYPIPAALHAGLPLCVHSDGMLLEMVLDGAIPAEDRWSPDGEILYKAIGTPQACFMRTVIHYLGFLLHSFSTVLKQFLTPSRSQMQELINYHFLSREICAVNVCK